MRTACTQVTWVSFRPYFSDRQGAQNSKFVYFHVMEQQADDNVPTTADIHAQYKTKAPKFEEKISVTDTEDLLALCQKHKAFTV